MCTMCEHPSKSNNIDNLLEQYKQYQREVYINNTSDNIYQLGCIAYKLEEAYEDKYRSDPTYRNEERMRYWRYIKEEHLHDGGYYRGDGYAWQRVAAIKNKYIWFVRRHGRFGGLTSTEEGILGAIGLGIAICSPAFLMVIFFGLFAEPR